MGLGMMNQATLRTLFAHLRDHDGFSGSATALLAALKATVAKGQEWQLPKDEDDLVEQMNTIRPDLLKHRQGYRPKTGFVAGEDIVIYRQSEANQEATRRRAEVYRRNRQRAVYAP